MNECYNKVSEDEVYTISCLKSMKNKLAGRKKYHKLISKMAITYFAAVIIPLSAISVYSFNLSERSIQNEIRQSSANTLDQIVESINFQGLIAKNIADKIAYNSSIVAFLSEPFTFNWQNLQYYENNIENFIIFSSNFNQVNIHSLSIYTSNHSIPEKWTHLFHDSRIDHNDWYREFIKNETREIWLSPSEQEGLFHVAESRPVFTLVRRIETLRGEFKGIATVSILADNFLSPIGSFEQENQGYSLLNSRYDVLYGESQITDAQLNTLIKQAAQNDSKAYLTNRNNLYLLSHIEPLDMIIIKFVNTSNMLTNYQVGSRIIFVALLTGMVVLILFFMFYIKALYAKINQIIVTMNQVGQGNLDIRVPVRSNDEIGQMANDFNYLIDRINELIKDVIKKETAHKDATIKALQYQIDPHFVYNTLDIFRMRMELIGDYRTAEAMADFSDMLRYNISGTDKYATLQKELNHVNSYIELQKIRLENRIVLFCDLSDDLKEIRVIKFLLQPIVENALRHGIGKRDQKLLVTISAERIGQDLLITVEDDGIGMDREKADCLNRQFIEQKAESSDDVHRINIGLTNINQRLKIFYGESYHLEIESRQYHYTRVKVRIPVDWE